MMKLSNKLEKVHEKLNNAQNPYMSHNHVA